MTECSINFTAKENPQTYELYQGLIQNGMDCHALDEGFHQMDYRPIKPVTKRVGMNDGVLEEREVLEYAIDHYEQYRGLVEGYLGYPIGWTLDDLDSTTHFDEQLRKQIKEAIQIIDSLLVDQGIVRGSDGYKEKLAICLFYYAFTPLDPTKISLKSQQIFLIQTSELSEIGLKKFQEYLVRVGGLGTALIYEDSEQEISALETLRTKKGWCTEQSKILFAVFRMAGLNPHFVEVDALEIHQVMKDRGVRIPNKFYTWGHQAIAIQLGNQWRIFDLAIFSSNANYRNFYIQSLIHYLSSDRVNRAIDLREPGKKLQEYQAALVLNPESPQIQAGLAHVYYTMGKSELAESACRKAIELNPNSFHAYKNLGASFESQKKYVEAEESYMKALKIDPEFVEAYSGLANIYYAQGKVDQAIQAHQKSIALDPNFFLAYNNLGGILLDVGRYEEAIPILNRAIALESTHAYLYVSLGKALNQTKRYSEAKIQFDKAIEREPIAFSAYIHQSISLWYLKRKDEVKESLQKMGDVFESRLTELVQEHDSLKVADEATKTIHDLIATLPAEMKEDQDLLSPLGEIYRRIGERYYMHDALDKAEQAFQQAIGFDKKTRAWWDLHKVYKASGKRAEALKACLEYQKYFQGSNDFCE